MLAMKFRDATHDDLAAVISLLADDTLGANREIPPPPVADCYVAAFRAIEADPHNRVIVAEDAEGVAGCLQLTLIPNLSHQGAWRAQIEAVRVAGRLRGQGVGRALFDHTIDEARRAGCTMVQLTTDRTRPEALAFYEQIGFTHSHAGMKMRL
jgi:GNAT superfamily N-acetyltransferase